MLHDVIAIVTRALSFGFDMFMLLLDATGTTLLWLAGVSFALFVSIVLMPFRGGHPVGGGSFGEFLSGKISSGKREAKREQERQAFRERKESFWRARENFWKSRSKSKS